MTPTVPAGHGADRQGTRCAIVPVRRDGRPPRGVSARCRRRWLPDASRSRDGLVRQSATSTTSAAEIRQAIAELDQRPWEHRKEDRRPLHQEFIRQGAAACRLRLAIADLISGELSCIKALAGVIALARGLRTRWQGQDAVGIMLPTSVGGVLVNLAAAVSGRVVVNLNFTAGKAAIDSAAAQAGCGHWLPAGTSSRKPASSYPMALR